VDLTSIGRPYIASVIRTINRSLPLAVPMAERLKLRTKACEDITCFLDAPGFHHVTKLDISTFSREITHFQPLYLPPLLSSIDASVPSGILTMVKGETVKHFTLDERCTEVVDIAFLNQWSNLSSLSLLSCMTLCHNFSPPSLTKLVISITQSEKIDSGTAFCQQLALFPERCPKLKHLEFSRCPEWDIFLIMLEKRNFLKREDISPISYVVLHGRCPPCIGSIIRDRVQGRLTPRLSNYDLSREGNIHIICDNTM
jgi:hypothetical protein